MASLAPFASALVGCKGNSETQGKATPAASSASSAANAANAANPANAANSPYVVGMVLVGPWNDHGWNQSHFEGIKAAIDKIPNVKFEFVDKVNPADRPNVKGSQVADDLIARGAKFIVFNSDDYKDDALDIAKKYPDVTVVHISGDYAWKDGKNYKNQKNLGNIMGDIESAQGIGGCAAALGTETGKIGYLGPLVNDETRRLVSSAYLGAKYCWEKYRKKPVKDLTFKVTWIGFWFNIPGVTLDPTKVSDDYYNGGYDVVMTGLDTPEAAVQAKKAVEAGKRVRYLHYDFKKGCDVAPDACLGVVYYNWTPSYLDAIQKAKEGKFVGDFVRPAPDYANMNGESSSIGFEFGKALGDKKAQLEELIKGLGDKSVNFFTGPQKFQDGSDFLQPGEVATVQKIWYMPQLLQGITGTSGTTKK
ncbi:BMP family protein [Pendulispora albinea]|uniref:BMP family ABC transporter substrate-binding protein n=1 Tax=Pendulispora albinea TaxID=2741071 RepID=A0ABZ2M1M8_9BACT